MASIDENAVADTLTFGFSLLQNILFEMFTFFIIGCNIPFSFINVLFHVAFSIKFYLIDKNPRHCGNVIQYN